ncbi:MULTISPECIES: acyl-CoA carboxylase subunit beta [Anaerotruncus]|jgi:acetyl-CoA carboxylase carboxyltransferase component|uniref:Methylmalonyl-CoA carboxyltransferase n=1 Tax=Anaerotruncus colihominis TaxID=169435 RepID=A0A845SW04_9FIRM|nr:MULTISPECIES: carboxyl transferase domain-containing protein [Anaerotruncus]MCI8492868.1 methylmalonyl-CoA carboxyltransferase [Anaerotruncus sp.]MCR2024354.1 methylmalonyl-CoA carboxyltransferase [Anaerotruncus colihominis]NBI79354.1 methylmalonyl-CoA carboxyltransferase [Anaerotruncus colihominis]NDO39098.1 methylmalonyl-CoA carboxyltransferase [Anaerotruncus colihominis]
MNKIEDLITRKTAIYQGNAKAIEKQHSSGKLTARERLGLLFDPGTFVEMDTFVTHRCTYFDMPSKHSPTDGVVCGYGKVDGRIVFSYAQDFTIMGGSLGEMQANKICHVLEAAAKVGAPVVGMNDSGGARIQEGIDGLSGYGKIFFRNTAASGVIPQITAIMGPCAGGAVYSPALTDFVFMVDQTSKMFITGPDVIKTVTGEVVTGEALGGATTHNKTSGVAHFMAKSDQECIQQIKRLLSFLPSNWKEQPPEVDLGDNPYRLVPELASILPDNANRAYNMYDVIRGIVDGGDYLDSQPLFATNMITCFARINKRAVGIIANQPRVGAGCLDINASDKAARFIRFCDAFGLPIVTLVDVPGFLPGTHQEYGGIIRHGAKMLYAYSEATVPKITLILRKAYGGAYLAMCCRELGADVSFAWPDAEIAVMGPEGAANIIFRKETPEQRAQSIAQYKAEFATPYKAAEHAFVDDVIHPAESRQKIVAALEMLRTKEQSIPKKRHGNIPL